MRRIAKSALLPLASSLALATAQQSVVYVTGLDIFSSLAPCAQYALSYNLQKLTSDACPEPVTELQSCACSKNNNIASISSDISSSLSWYCGATASEDAASVSTVFSAYCNQNNAVAFPKPTSPVSVYITDIAEANNLAPCAYSGVAYALQSMSSLCPPDAPSLATCACFKNQNALVVSQNIVSDVKYSCSSHTADISSAQALFKAYCALNNGTSSFPQPVPPPGQMTYHITDLPQYSALAPCASSAVSYAVLKQTTELCPTGVQALASCACLKDGLPSEILSSITSSVKWYCDSTATDDISSAVAVYNLYCSAAKGEVVAGGVTVSVSQTYASATSDSGAGGAGGGAATPTAKTGGTVAGGAGASRTASSGSSTTNTSNSNSTSGRTNTTLIGGVIGGIVAGIAIIAALVVFLVKQARARKANTHQEIQNAPPPPPPATSTTPDYWNGKQELAADSIAAPPPPPSPSPSTLKVGTIPSRIDNVSPVSAHATPYTLTPPQAELHGQAAMFPPRPRRTAPSSTDRRQCPSRPNSRGKPPCIPPCQTLPSSTRSKGRIRRNLQGLLSCRDTDRDNHTRPRHQIGKSFKRKE
ncbi:hypothetical protein B0T17DRAFT_167902 [Bombardia bombarda]|uniref:Uncharacterized protein n=1 Tax=Bombardia bombarda TaxID=252184 RepID=A0AA39X8E2_9PEZI|nr:hypothetical protein B0T17DRAFT_167902 [Bombardia bombarda]